MWRKLLKIFGVKSACICTEDEVIYYRIIRNTPFGMMCKNKGVFDIHQLCVKLVDDGTFVDDMKWLIEQLEQAQATNQKLVECLEGIHSLLCQAAAHNETIDIANLANWIESTLSEVKGNE